MKIPKLSEFDYLRRYIWCKNNQNENFENLFVDETTIRILEVSLYDINGRNSRPEDEPCISKIRLKINIWGGISTRGPSPLAVNIF